MGVIGTEPIRNHRVQTTKQDAIHNSVEVESIGLAQFNTAIVIQRQTRA